jgi:hypothetical protein
MVFSSDFDFRATLTQKQKYGEAGDSRCRWYGEVEAKERGERRSVKEAKKRGVRSPQG